MGVIITSDGGCLTEIKRIGQVKAALQKMNNIVCVKDQMEYSWQTIDSIRVNKLVLEEQYKWSQLD